MIDKILPSVQSHIFPAEIVTHDFTFTGDNNGVSENQEETDA